MGSQITPATSSASSPSGRSGSAEERTSRNTSGVPRRGNATYSYTAYIYAEQHPRSGDDMSVRQSLLAILDQAPCYGYQLRTEFDRRTGSTWPLNVGQIYSTLDRLERDGLVMKGETDEHGHVYYAITDA